MNRVQYHTQIAQANTARELHQLRRMAETDAELKPEAREAIRTAIANRFGKLNADVANLKPRWA